MTIAKGLSSGYAPIAAAIVRESVYDVFKENKEAAMGHLLTFGGHPAACAAALQNLVIFEREDLVGQSAEKGKYLRSRLEELRAHPTVGDVRGIGLMCGIDLVKNKETREGWGKTAAFTARPWRAGLATRTGDPGLGRDALRAAAGDRRGRDRPDGRDRGREPDDCRAGIRCRDYCLRPSPLAATQGYPAQCAGRGEQLQSVCIRRERDPSIVRMTLPLYRPSAAVSRVEAEATENRAIEARLEREANRAYTTGADRRVEALTRIGWTDGDRPRAS